MSRRMVSVVAVVRNSVGMASAIMDALSHATSQACEALALDHEVLLVDNGSTDGTFDTIEALLPLAEDMRAIALVSSGDPEPALLAGMEHALGDWVILFDPYEDSAAALSAMVAALSAGADIVLAAPRPSTRGFAYDLLSRAFVAAFRGFVGVDLRVETSRYRGMSRRVVAFVTSHDNAATAHRALPAMGGFRTVTVSQEGGPMAPDTGGETLRGAFRRAMALLTSASSAPLRMATATCAAAATLSLAYSIYVAVVYMLGTDVAPGWTTMSLQISGMFFLLAVAVALLSEHVVQMAASSHRRPPYHMAREARSPALTREQRLNVV